MSTAVAEPKKLPARKKTAELDTRNIPVDQKPVLTMPSIEKPMDRQPEVVVFEGLMSKEYADQIAFDEEPVKILIHGSDEEFAPRCTDLIAINGIKAEMLFKNGWVPMGYLPRGQAIYVKRKYVSVLAAAKTDKVTTRVIERDNEDPTNVTERFTKTVLSFTVLEDKNPRGAEWLERLVRQRM